MNIRNRILKACIVAIGCTLVTACVVEGDKASPLRTEQGKQEAIQAYIDLAFGYVRTGQLEQAKEPLLDALKINSNSADANAAMAYVFQLENDPKNAQIFFEKAVKEQPENTRILNNYGVFLFEQNKLVEAKAFFLKASQDSFYSERSMVFENLGLISLRQQLLNEAQEYFDQALLFNKIRPVSLFSLADIYYQKKNYTKSLGYYNNFLAIIEGRQSPQSLLFGIRLSTALNDKQKVASYASQLQQLFPSSPEYLAYKAGKI